MNRKLFAIALAATIAVTAGCKPDEAAEAAAAPAADDTVAKLQQLAELKSQGILTEEEFAAQKAKILGS